MNPVNSLSLTLAIAILACCNVATAAVFTLSDDFEDGASTEASWAQGVRLSHDSLITVQGGNLVLDATTIGVFGSLDRNNPCAPDSSSLSEGYIQYRNTEMSISYDMKFLSDTGGVSAGAALLAPDRNTSQSAIVCGIIDSTLFILYNDAADISRDIVLNAMVLPANFDRFSWHHFDVTLSGGVVTIVMDQSVSLAAAVPAVIPTDPAFGGPGGAGLFAGRLEDTIGAVVAFDNYTIAGDAVCDDIPAMVDIIPDKINTRAGAKFISVHITLPAGSVVDDIILESIKIVGLTGATCDPNYVQFADLSVDPVIEDFDGDGIPDLTVKFDRQLLQENLCADDVSIAIEGDLVNGDRFVGQDSISVFSRGRP